MKNWEQIYQEKGLVQDEPSKDVVQLVPKLKKEGIERILDHGCGTGRHVKFLAEQGFYVVGTDYSDTALEYSKKLTQYMNNIEFKQVEMDNIPFKDEYFDAIISIHVIQHALKEQRDKAFNEIYRTLRYNGLLFLKTISKKHKLYGKGKEIESNTFIEISQMPDGKTPHHYFSENELREYLNQFEILTFKHNSFPAEPNGFWKCGLEEWMTLARKK